MNDAPHQPPTLVRDLFGWYSLTLLALGERTGLLDALIEGPGTAEEVATRAGVDTRNTFEWLRGVVAAGHATHVDGVFEVDATTAMILGPSFPADFRAVMRFTQAVPTVMGDVALAVRSGTGVPPTAYGDVSAAASAVNTPMYRAALVQEWIAGVPCLADRLTAGARVADVAAGNGEAAALVAEAFPASTVVGYDVAPSVSAELPANVELRRADARELPDDGPFDLVYVLDSLHHLGDPLPVLAGIHRNLAPDGVVMLVESNMSGSLDDDVADPFAVVSYACGVLYCLQEGLSAGGVHSNADGTGWITDALAETGFSDITITASDTGYAVITATP